MISNVIRWSIRQRLLVLLLTVIFSAWGIYAIKQVPIDALPDLTDLKIIVVTSFPGQSPEVIESQVTYPISSVMLSVPNAISIKGYSILGNSYVEIVFPKDVDIYWARARVTEALDQIKSSLPPMAKTSLGPDASDIGWIYEYALVDKTGQHDLSQLRSIQDWNLKLQLRSIPGVSEVATVGGMVKQYQIVLDPNRLRAHNISINTVIDAVRRSNQNASGSVIEMAEAEYIVQARGYIANIDDIRIIPLATSADGIPIVIKDIATVRLGPQMRRGIAELNGLGEVVGGIVILRRGGNVHDTIRSVNQKISEIKQNLPDGVEIIETYNRLNLIERSIENIVITFAKQIGIIFVVCLVFFYNFRLALNSIFILPVVILFSFIIFQQLGVNLNLVTMSVLFIVILLLMDAIILLIDYTYRQLQKSKKHTDRWLVIENSTIDIAPVLFFSLLVILISFIPISIIDGRVGELFSMLSYTIVLTIIAAIILILLVVPILTGYLIRENVAENPKNQINKYLITLFSSVIHWVMENPVVPIVTSSLLVMSMALPLSQFEFESIPEVDEGDLVYTATTLSSVSIGKAGELLQITDRLIKSVPEVKTAFGKIGHAETATDKAPLTKIETIIQLKPQHEWRVGMTLKKLKKELNEKVSLPGLLNAWTMPIKLRNEINQYNITPSVDIQIFGIDDKVIQKIGEQIADVLKKMPDAKSIHVEKLLTARYIDIEINRWAAARYGLNVADVQEIINSAVGGGNITNTIEGLEQYPVNIRYPQIERDSVDKLLMLPLVSPSGAHLTLGDVTTISITEGSATIKSKNARRFGWVNIKISESDYAHFTAEAKQAVEKKIKLPTGYSLNWIDHKQDLFFDKEKFLLMFGIVLITLFLLVAIYFKNLVEAFIVILTAPISMAGAFWVIYLMGYNLSIVTNVSLIAVAGVSISFSAVMLMFLKAALKKYAPNNETSLKKAIIHGVIVRLRSKIIAIGAVIVALLPLMLNSGTGFEILNRLAAPLMGGMIIAPMVSLLLIPTLYLLWKRKKLV